MWIPVTSGLPNSNTGIEMEDNSKAVMKSLSSVLKKGLGSLAQYLPHCLWPVLQTLYWCCKRFPRMSPHSIQSSKRVDRYLNAKFNEFKKNRQTNYQRNQLHANDFCIVCLFLQNTISLLSYSICQVIILILWKGRN